MLSPFIISHSKLLAEYANNIRSTSFFVLQRHVDVSVTTEIGIFLLYLKLLNMFAMTSEVQTLRHFYSIGFSHQYWRITCYRYFGYRNYYAGGLWWCRLLPDGCTQLAMLYLSMTLVLVGNVFFNLIQHIACNSIYPICDEKMKVTTLLLGIMLVLICNCFSAAYYPLVEICFVAAGIGSFGVSSSCFYQLQEWRPQETEKRRYAFGKIVLTI